MGFMSNQNADSSMDTVFAACIVTNLAEKARFNAGRSDRCTLQNVLFREKPASRTPVPADVNDIRTFFCLCT
jgi:hypothetical protein